MLRKHQAQMKDYCEEAIANPEIERIYANVTPGGGKSLLPLIMGKELIGPRIDRIAWVVPRDNLRQQAEGSFKEGMDVVGLHSMKLRAIESASEHNPSRGCTGFVTTYQALDADKGRTLGQEFDRHRYGLVLDEFHHVAANGSWHRAIEPLLDRAAFTLLMTGSINRGDRGRIAELPYVMEGGREIVRLEPTDASRVIRYTRRDALEERAVIPLYGEFHDGGMEWIDRAGEEQSISTFTEEGYCAGDALFTALRTDFACTLLDRCLADWYAYRRTHRRSKLLVVAPEIAQANFFLKFLQGQSLNVGIATSENSDAAKSAIKKFRTHGPGSSDILVTVAMAYEGMDVPAITHIACLTHIRSWPWLEQMLARGTRFDHRAGDWTSQGCYVHAPSDPMLAEAFKKIREEQAEFIVNQEPTKPPPTMPGTGTTPPPGTDYDGDVIPIDGQATRSWSSDMEGKHTIPPQEHARLKRAMEVAGFVGSPVQFKQAMEAYQADTATTEEEPTRPPTGERHKEDAIKQAIEKHSRKYAAVMGIEFGKVNGLIKKQFGGKPRDDMTRAELIEVWKWIKKNLIPKESA